MSQIEAVRSQRDKLRPLVDAALNFVARKDALMSEADRARGDQLVETAHKASLGIAEIFLKLGQLTEAMELFGQALGLGVEVAVLNARLGALYLRNDDFAAAAAHFKNAATLEPAVAAHAFQLGRTLYRAGRIGEAVEALEAALALEPNAVRVLNELAMILLFQGDMERARALCERALAAEPGDFPSLFNLGQAQQALGQIQAAKDAFRRALAVKPGHADCHRLLGMLQTYTPNDPRIAQMQSIHAQSADNAEWRMKIGFALYKALDDIGRHDEAFAYLKEANGLRRADFPDYRVEDDLAQMQAIGAWFTKDRIAALSDLGNAQERPIFIVGLPRSGTSLTEQILASHPDVHGAGEVESLGPLVGRRFCGEGRRRTPLENFTPDAAMVEDVGQRYIEPLKAKAGGRLRIVDKMPNNFLWVGHILMMFPNARIVMVRRDPLANCFAAFGSYFPSRGMQFSYNLEDAGRYYRGHRELARHWTALYPDAVMDFSYEDLTENQQRETRRLLEFCGLDWDSRCLDFHMSSRAVITLSASQVRQGMYSGVDRRTAHYAAHLEPLRRALAGGAP